MEDTLSTGFQSSRRMLRQIRPSWSMLGWYTCQSGSVIGTGGGLSLASLAVHRWHQQTDECEAQVQALLPF